MLNRLLNPDQSYYLSDEDEEETKQRTSDSLRNEKEREAKRANIQPIASPPPPPPPPPQQPPVVIVPTAPIITTIPSVTSSPPPPPPPPQPQPQPQRLVKRSTSDTKTAASSGGGGVGGGSGGMTDPASLRFKRKTEQAELDAFSSYFSSYWDNNEEKDEKTSSSSSASDGGKQSNPKSTVSTSWTREEIQLHDWARLAGAVLSVSRYNRYRHQDSSAGVMEPFVHVRRPGHNGHFDESTPAETYYAYLHPALASALQRAFQRFRNNPKLKHLTLYKLLLWEPGRNHPFAALLRTCVQYEIEFALNPGNPFNRLLLQKNTQAISALCGKCDQHSIFKTATTESTEPATAATSTCDCHSSS